jgi:hypothetical protein
MTDEDDRKAALNKAILAKLRADEDALKADRAEELRDEAVFLHDDDKTPGRTTQKMEPIDATGTARAPMPDWPKAEQAAAITAKADAAHERAVADKQAIIAASGVQPASILATGTNNYFATDTRVDPHQAPTPLPFPLSAFTFENTNTANVTLNLNGIGQKPIRMLINGTMAELPKGTLIPGTVYNLSSDGNQYALGSVVVPVAGKPTDPNDRAKHPPVYPAQGQMCSVPGCGWTFGDRNFVEPHPVETIPTAPKMTPLGQPVVVAPPRPAPSPTAHEAVPRGAECPLCHWKYGDLEAHPSL